MSTGPWPLLNDTRGQPIGIAHFTLVLVAVIIVWIILSEPFSMIESTAANQTTGSAYDTGSGYLSGMFNGALIPLFFISVIGLLTYTIYKRPGGF